MNSVIPQRLLTLSSLSLVMVLGLGVNGSKAISFQSPNDEVPSTVGGGVRGQIQFQSPNREGNLTTAGAGVRGQIQFQSPNREGNLSTAGAGVRGQIQFQSPNENTDIETTSGGVRGNVTFQSPSNDRSHNYVGAGVRGDGESEIQALEAATSIAMDGDMEEGQLTLTALIPENNYGRTIAPRPTFNVYLPDTYGADSLFFSIHNEREYVHFQTIINIPGQGGIVSVPLPPEAPDLALDENYHWYIAPLRPLELIRPDSINVGGWIRRVEAPLSAANENNSIIDQATALAAAGVWYDTINLLVEGQTLNPEDPNLAEEWHDLLAQVNLGHLSQQPLNNVITTEPLLMGEM